MGHPEDDYTRGSEVGNITNKEIRESVAKNISAGAHLLRSLLTGDECIYDEDDERHYECKQCIEAIETIERERPRKFKGHESLTGQRPDFTNGVLLKSRPLI